MMPTSSRKRLSPHDRLRLAVAAECDPRTIDNWCKGKTIRPTTLQRIERAVRELFGAAA